MKINVNYLFHCKRHTPYKDKHYVQIVHCFFQFLFTSIPGYLPSYDSSLQLFDPLILPDLRDCGLFYSSVFFQYLFHLGFDLFDKHVEKVLLQHGLGTPYSNSACFDKDDIWTFCSFLYSACQLHYFPPPSPKIEFYNKLVIGLN